MPKFTIRYQYGTYSGTRVVFADDDERAVAKMWADMRRRGELGLSMAHQSAKVIDLEEPADDE